MIFVQWRVGTCAAQAKVLVRSKQVLYTKLKAKYIPNGKRRHNAKKSTGKTSIKFLIVIDTISQCCFFLKLKLISWRWNSCASVSLWVNGTVWFTCVNLAHMFYITSMVPQLSICAFLGITVNFGWVWLNKGSLYSRTLSKQPLTIQDSNSLFLAAIYRKHVDLRLWWEQLLITRTVFEGSLRPLLKGFYCITTIISKFIPSCKTVARPSFGQCSSSQKNTELWPTLQNPQ